jgi:peroxiredoxin
MRTIFIFLAILLVSGSCNKSDNGYTVRLELEDADGQWILLSARADRQYVVFDSVRVEAGTPAILSGKVDGVRTMYLGPEGQKKAVRILLENADYTVTGTLSDPVITGTGKAQQELNDNNEKNRGIEGRLEDILQNIYAAKANNDQQARDSIIEAYEKVSMEKDAIDSVYIATHPASAVSVLLLRNTFYLYDTDDLDRVLSSLDPSLRHMDEYVYMHSILERQKEVAIGLPFKDFGLETPEGELLKISDVHQGNVLLIDFWASWCGPCRRANPEMVELYNKYHERGLEILGVSLDQDTASWIKAIRKDGLVWNQISDVQGWNCKGSKLYGVPAIPHTVLIDREGIIRGKKLHGAELEEAIEELL